jgi:hypothetical protein
VEDGAERDVGEIQKEEKEVRVAFRAIRFDSIRSVLEF